MDVVSSPAAHVVARQQYARSDNKAEFEVAEEATKAQIKKAFSKSLGNKKMNKKILSSFIERIA